MSMRATLRKEAKKEDGAAAVEFALIVGLLAILVFGLLEYGLAFWQVQNLRAATREGAREAAVGGSNAEIRTAMVNAAGGSLTGGEAITVTPPLCNDDTTRSAGDRQDHRQPLRSRPGGVQGVDPVPAALHVDP